MDKVSVIIPTMWRCDDTLKIISQIQKEPLVHEIIVIDNSIEGNTDVLDYSKVVYLKQSKNLYVNASWNLGTHTSKSDKLLFLNDDCNTDWDIFEKVLPYINCKNGMIGTYFNLPEDESFSYKTQSHLDIIDINPLTYGCLFFMHKSSYVDIPSELKIMWGDVFLFFASKKPNYLLYNWPVWGYVSQTSSSPEFKAVIDYDYYMWESKIKNIIF